MTRSGQRQQHTQFKVLDAKERVRLRESDCQRHVIPHSIGFSEYNSSYTVMCLFSGVYKEGFCQPFMLYEYEYWY